MEEEAKQTEAAPQTETAEVPVEQTDFENIADDIMGSEPVEALTETPLEPVVEEPKETPVMHKVKVDGQESEVTTEELIAGYRYNAHNTQKAQSLADQERELAAMQGLANQLRTDTNFANHVFGYGKESPQTEELDPIEQIKADAVKAAEEKVEKRFKTQDIQARQAEIDNLKSHVSQDPLYSQVQTKLAEFVKGLPPTMQKSVFQTLDSDPASYKTMYEKFRSTIEEPKKPKVNAPVLVDSGQSQEVPVETTLNTNRKKMKAEMLKTGNLSNLQEYFTMEGGLADQLV